MDKEKILAEAKRRYPQKTKYKPIFNDEEQYTIVGNLFWFINDHYKIGEAIASQSCGLIYIKGKWATIISTPIKCYELW